MRNRIVFTLMLLLFFASGFSQKRMVTGKVTDSQGKPVPYATVTVKGTNTAVGADENGAFNIEAEPNSILIFSASGFQAEEVNIAARTSVTAIVNDRSNLNEVVVTALGIRRTRNSLPYATQQISGAELNKTITTNFVDNLSGKVAGLQITSSSTMGGSNNVILRGLKSLTQSNQALFVVDGVPYDNSNQSVNTDGSKPGDSGFDLGNTVSDLNPEDIESINVLKGAAASALYGSRAINGVILITTKKGKKNAPVGVSFNLGIAAGTPDKSTLPVYQTQYGEGFGTAAADPNFPNEAGYFYYTRVFNSNGQRVHVVQTSIDAATGPAYDPSLSVYNWDAFAPGDPNYGKATPWAPAAHHNPTDFFVTPVTSSANVFVDGGSEKGTFKMGLSHNDDKGYLPNADLVKNLVNFSATHNITDNLTIGAQFNYADVRAIGRYYYGYTGTSNLMTDFRQWWPTNVDLQAQKRDFFNTGKNVTWNWLPNAFLANNPTAQSLALPAYHNNYYWDRYVNFENDSRDRYFGNINLNYKISNAFNLMGRMSIDNYLEQVETRYDIGSVEPSGYSRYNSIYKEVNYDLLLNFDKNLSKNINLKALLGANIRQVNNESVTASTNGGLVVPGLFSLSNTVSQNSPTEYVGRKEVDGIFSGATLSYKEWVTIDATVRRDQSSTLPKSNNTYYYPAISGNFLFSKLLPTASWLTFGKIRANYAEVGGDAPVYSVSNTYTSIEPVPSVGLTRRPLVAFNGQPVYSLPYVNNNPNLLPESNKTYEAGAELSFLQNRISVDLTYYNAKQINQILPIFSSQASGFTYQYVNGGAVQNKGWELVLGLTPVKTKNFTWNINANWSKNQNRVLSLYNGQPSFVMTQWQNSVQLVAEVGKSEGIIRGTDYQYLNGKPLIDGNGYYVKSTNSLSDIGNINPDWMGGVNNSFRYKNLTFSFLLDVKRGGSVYSLDMDYGSGSGLYPETAGLNDKGKPVRSPVASGGGIILPGVTADGKPNTTRIDASDVNNVTGSFPFSSSYVFTDKSYVYDASYVKLRETALTYALPRSIIGSSKIVKGIDLSLTGKNLWIIHKNIPYADPEQGVASGNHSMGFQSGAYPTYRMFGFNIKVKF